MLKSSFRELETFSDALVDSVDVGEAVASASNRMMVNLRTMLG
jgi:hypothetical protein